MRALAFSVTSLALGITAHVLAGGAAPTLPVLGFLGAFVFLCSQALAGGERGLPSLAPATAVVQVGVHLTLMSSGAVPRSMSMPMGGMSGQAMRLTGGMLAAHAMAALGAALLMRAAEAGLWRLRRWFGVMIRLPVSAPVWSPPAAARASRTGRPSFPGQGLMLASATLRRGPPAVA